MSELTLLNDVKNFMCNVNVHILYSLSILFKLFYNVRFTNILLKIIIKN